MRWINWRDSKPATRAEVSAEASQEYDLMVSREQGFYHGERPSASIPPIFTYWAVKSLAPRMKEMFGTISVEEFYANEIERVAPHGSLSVLSLGSGEASTELEIARILVGRGRTIKFYGSDISPAMSEAGRVNAESKGLSEHFEFLTFDINKQFPETDATVVLANHSLHHFVELEFILDNVKRQIGDDGALITNDMIGRNGHQRWPEVLAYTEMFWRLLPRNKRVDRIHMVPHIEYVDFDCANGTFEGIRAQDILPLCVEKFHFERFLGAGGIPDTFTDRMYGSNFATDEPFDTAFIDTVDMVNTDLLVAGKIKPTIMFATMRNKQCDCISWPVTADKAVRTPG
ncbi:class I SAM-dependent methyltransferase [Mesorhizobium sp. BR1-1-3]|uniref:class I SAM-dependent methyltransferase n=1 Tax=Mesorhizobium sp. BR1-1-3 TaxID=2876651 RepID=UPI001CD0B4A4|nr:class I SAM-dependent methyltransferase [Mesorhizobium sp. BR1-1-3]MBZ9888938.1 class I SAM-dependent methyltransferase [Mesorhizobium sp. BR1-1-3]